MEIRYKLYPYPVLAYYSDDYKDGSFDTTIDLQKDGYNIRIDFMASLTNEGLKKLIEDGQAQYVYHLECAQTGFREVVTTEKVSESYMLSDKKICGKLQICPFIVATQDITGYSNPGFHDDYSGATFDIEAGCVFSGWKAGQCDHRKRNGGFSKHSVCFQYHSQRRSISDTHDCGY